MSTVITHKCPSCGAPILFNPAKQKWICDYCLTEHNMEDVEGNTDKINTGADNNKEENKTIPKSRISFYSCPSCGAELITDVNTVAAFCAFCHSPAIIAGRIAETKRPEKILPFKLSHKDAVSLMHQKLKSKFFLPRDFITYLDKGEILGLYVPFWLFSAVIDINATGTAYVYESWSDSKYNYEKTDTFHVERRALIPFSNIPADGSKNLDDKIIQAIEPFNYSQMENFSEKYLSGYFAETFDVNHTEAEKEAHARMYEFAKKFIKGQITGYSSCSIDSYTPGITNSSHSYVMMPVYILSANYNGKNFKYLINGQSGKMGGKLPINYKKVFLYFGILTVLFSALITIGGLLL